MLEALDAPSIQDSPTAWIDSFCSQLQSLIQPVGSGSLFSVLLLLLLVYHFLASPETDSMLAYGGNHREVRRRLKVNNINP